MIHIQGLVWINIFISFGYIPRKKESILEMLGHMVTMFNIFRNCQTVFQSGCPILHSHQHGMRVPVSSRPSHHLLLAVFWIIAILVGVK